VKLTTVKLGIVCVSLILGLILTGVSNAQIDPSNCVGLWLFDEGQGTVAKDTSGNGLDGTLNNNPQWVDGKFGKALQFAAPWGQHVFVDGVTIPPTGWSISSWINRNVNPEYAIWMNHNNVRKDGATLHLMFPGGSNTPTMAYHGDGAGFPLVNAVAEGAWTHIVFVVAADGRKVYVNGVLDNSDANTVGYNGGTAPLLIGMFLDCCQFVGAIDEVGVFNVALTQDDVVNVMTNGLAKATNVSPVSPNGLLTTAWGEIRGNVK
jgi:hypothetical protein